MDPREAQKMLAGYRKLAALRNEVAQSRLHRLAQECRREQKRIGRLYRLAASDEDREAIDAKVREVDGIARKVQRLRVSLERIRKKSRRKVVNFKTKSIVVKGKRYEVHEYPQRKSQNPKPREAYLMILDVLVRYASDDETYWVTFTDMCREYPELESLRRPDRPITEINKMIRLPKHKPLIQIRSGAGYRINSSDLYERAVGEQPK